MSERRVEAPVEKKRIGIEDLLRWAYREELPKAQAVSGLMVGPAQFGQAWGGIERYGDLLTIVDAPSNRWGLVPDLTALREPDPDAVRIGQAVLALDERALGLPDDWYPLADLGDLGDLGMDAVGRALASATTVDAAGVRSLRTPPHFLVVRHALAGTAPVWEAEAPRRKVETGANGKPRWFRRVVLTGDDGVPYEIEMNGYDSRMKGPVPGAYRKEYLDPDPMEAAVARAEYEVWHAALGVLVDQLAGTLVRFDVQPTQRPARPWEMGGDLPPRRVLPCLRSERYPQARPLSRAKKRVRV